jgi:hypothetical protein
LPAELAGVPLVACPAELVIGCVAPVGACADADGAAAPAVWTSAEAVGVFALIVALGTDASSGAVGVVAATAGVLSGTVGVVTVSGAVSTDTLGVATVTVGVGNLTVTGAAETETPASPGDDAGASIASAVAAARAQIVVVSLLGRNIEPSLTRRAFVLSESQLLYPLAGFLRKPRRTSPQRATAASAPARRPRARADAARGRGT